MIYIKIILSTLGSIIALFFSTKVIGNKQMSQLNMFDYINGITIGSIGAEMATSLEGDFIYPLISIIIYTFIIWLISFIGSKWMPWRRFFSGRSVFLMEGGKLYEKNFTMAKIDINEFLTQCRIKGYFNMDEIDTVVLEQNGQISVMPKRDDAPITPKIMNFTTKPKKVDIVVIMDGHILGENLIQSGNNKNWLEKQLISLKIGSISDVFLGVCDENNQLNAFMKNGEIHKNDIFQ